MKRLVAPVVFLVAVGLAAMAFSSSIAVASRGLLVTPTEVLLGSIDASTVSMLELGEGLSVFLPETSAEAGPATQPLSIFLRQPLTNESTGRPLPASRVYLGIDGLQPLPDSGVGSVPLPPHSGLVRLRFAVRVEPFDQPGTYEGKLSLVDSSEGERVVELPIELELRQWVKAKLMVCGTVLAAATGEAPGPDSYLNSGQATVVQVASNGRWSLTARVKSDFVPETEATPGARPIPATELRVRVVPTEWVEPLTEGFARLAKDPVILATGRPTGEYANGWVPVSVEASLPFDRSHAAGDYVSSLAFAVVALGP